LVAKVTHVVSQPTFAYEGWLTVTAAGATYDSVVRLPHPTECRV